MKHLGLAILMLVCGFTNALAQVGTPCTCAASGLPGRCLTSSATISQPGLYCVTQDFSTGGAYHISSDNVTLDGQGHRMNLTAGGRFFTIAKGPDPALPSFMIRTFNVTVKNFTVIARNIAYNDMIDFDTVSNSSMENVTLKVLGGSVNTGGKVMGMYQSYLNRFVGNTFILTAPSGNMDLFSIRNGTCGTQFINNTFVGVNLTSGSNFIKLNSGDQTLGRGAVGDTIFSGNRIYSSINGILDQSHASLTGVTLTNNLIYTNWVGFGGASASNAWFEVSGNTFISTGDRPFTIGDADGNHVTSNMKNNIFFADGGGNVMDLHVETINANYNNLFSKGLSNLVWSKYDGRGALGSGPVYPCLTGCAPREWRNAWRENNSVSIGPTLNALFVDPVVDLTLDANDNPKRLGDFNLRASSGLKGIGEGGVDLGSPGGNGLNYPLYCGVPKPGLIPGDSNAPASPANLRSSS